MNSSTLKLFLIAGIVTALLLANSQRTGLAANPPIYAGGQKLSRGGRIRVENPSGPITVEGWDQDTVQAIVEGSDRQSSVSVQEIRQDLLSITPDFHGHPHGGEVHLVIRMPRAAGIQYLNTGQGAVEVTNIEGPVNVNSRNGSLKINSVGSLNAFTANGQIEVRSVSGDAKVQTSSGEVTVVGATGKVNIQTANGGVEASNTGPLSIHTSSGAITARNIAGSATLESANGDISVRQATGDVIAKVTSGDFQAEDIRGVITLAIASGDVTIANTGSDVKVSSISSDIDLKCAKGAVDLSSVSGSIVMAGVGGDVSAMSTSGDVKLSATIRPHGHYKLKSASGEVTLLIQGDSGFTATLSSYTGEIETDFPLKLDTPLERGPVNRRIIGRYGDGEADLTLDSFSGSARLAKTSGHGPNCK